MAESMSSHEMLEQISRTLSAEGGRFILVYDDHRSEWTAGMEWGREDEDSDMAGAASYGVGESAAEAVQLMLEDR